MKKVTTVGPQSALDVARLYLAGGVSVFPVSRGGEGGWKSPASKLLPLWLDPDDGRYRRSWNPFRERPPTEEDLERWYAVAEPPGIAAACGAVSGGLELLDFDGEAEETFAAWCGLVKEVDEALLSKVAVVRSPKPGYHVWLRSEVRPVPSSAVLAADPVPDPGKPGKTRKVKLIETRGEGGYALLPGCPAECHETGRCYEHLDGPALWDLKPLTADERDALFSAARSLDRTPPPEPRPAYRPPLVEGTRPGDVFDARADWAEVLEPFGWRVWRVQGDVTYWTRPGKAKGVSASTGKAVKGGVPLLHVFTSSTELESGGTYGPFNALVALKYAGRHSDAAKELYRQGYREERPQLTPIPSANGHQPGPPPWPGLDAEPTPWPAPPGEVAYSGLAGEIVRRIAPQTEADLAAVLVQILVMFGNAIGRKAHWKVENDHHYGNLYCCLMGETGKGRKGTSKGRALQAFCELPSSDDWAKMRVGSGLSSGEGLIYAVRDPSFKLHHVKVRGRVTETQNVQEDPGVRDKRLLVVEPEFGRVLRVMEREGNTLSARLRESWDTGNLSNMTKGGMRATGAHVSIIGHVTRCELTKLLSDVDAANGLANRFLWVAVKRSKLLPMGGDPVDLGGTAGLLADAVAHGQKVDEIPFDADARALWCDELYTRLTRGGPGLLGAITNRAEAQVRRLALLYALLDFKAAVGLTHLLAAVALWEFAGRSARWAFGESTGNRVADEILDALVAAGTAGLSGRDVHGLFGRHLDGRTLKGALAVLVDANLARAEKVETGGRPGQRWYACEQSAQSEQRGGEHGKG